MATQLGSFCPGCGLLAEDDSRPPCPECGHEHREAVFIGEPCDFDTTSEDTAEHCPSPYHHESGVHFWSFAESERLGLRRPDGTDPRDSRLADLEARLGDLAARR